MTRLLTDWEHLMLSMPLEDYMELCPCDCHALCTCDEKETRE